MFVKVFLLVVLAAIAMSSATPATDLLVGPVDVNQEWAKWKTEHNRSYESSEEEAKRFTIFQENLKKITEHNKKFQAGEVTWSQELNKFADLNQEEFSQNFLGVLQKPKEKRIGSMFY